MHKAYALAAKDRSKIVPHNFTFLVLTALKPFGLSLAVAAGWQALAPGVASTSRTTVPSSSRCGEKEMSPFWKSTPPRHLHRFRWP